MFTAGRKLVPAATHNITAVGDGTLSLNTPLHLYLGTSSRRQHRQAKTKHSWRVSCHKWRLFPLLPLGNLFIFTQPSRHEARRPAEVAEGSGAGNNTCCSPHTRLTYSIQAKNSSGSGVDAANVMLAQLNAQKTVKKKISPAPAPPPGNQTHPGPHHI